MRIKVSKFGGSSLADAAQFAKVKSILLSDADRRIVVPSAPGKRSSVDIKVTDLFYECNRLASAGKEIDAAFAEYDSAFRGGRSTDSAGSMMTEAMAHTRRALDAHYNDDASLK